MNKGNRDLIVEIILRVTSMIILIANKYLNANCKLNCDDYEFDKSPYKRE